MTTQAGTLSDLVAVSGSPTTTGSYGVSASNAIAMSDLSYVRWNAFIEQRIGLDGATSSIITYGALAEDVLRIIDQAGTTGVYNVSLVQALTLQDLLRVVIPVTVAETLGLHLTQALSQGVRLAETLRLGAQFDLQAEYQTTVVARLGLSGLASRFFGALLFETLGFQDAPLFAYEAGALVQEQLGLADDHGYQLIIRADLSEDLALADDNILQAIYQQTVDETIQLSAAHVSPDGTITTWSINTRTGAVTEYRNYAFNSFAKMQHHYLGASADGLYELIGDQDDGADIIADIKSGLAQFGVTRMTSFTEAYLGLRSNGQFLLKLVTGDGKEYLYSVSAKNMRTTKVKFGKGLRSRYFSWELVSTGQDFDLDTVEFVPINSKRRVD
jgi:hypothetical protein